MEATSQQPFIYSLFFIYVIKIKEIEGYITITFDNMLVIHIFKC